MTSESIGGDFDFVVDVITRNYSGFPDKVGAMNTQEYLEFTEVLRQEFARANSPSSRVDRIREWLGFFGDLHLSVSTDHFVVAGESDQSTEPHISVIDDRSIVVRIPSFEPEHIEKIHDIVEAHHEEITRRSNLIVDLRGNGGGSDDGMEVLLPYIHSGSIEVVGADVRSSVDNAQHLRNLLQRYEFPDETKRVIEERVEEMELNTDQFIEWVPTSTLDLGEVLPMPERVGLVVDRNCASTTEQLVIFAQQSSKVVIFGETTAGCIDYSNVVSVSLPSGEGVLNYPITRSKRVGVAAIDGFGIQPDIAVEPQSENLISVVTELLKSR